MEHIQINFLTLTPTNTPSTSKLLYTTAIPEDDDLRIYRGAKQGEQEEIPILELNECQTKMTMIINVIYIIHIYYNEKS